MIILVIIAVLAVAMAGCASSPETPSGGKTGEIDAALQHGPVFVEFGAAWCEWCEKEKPVTEALSAEYHSITFVDVDVDVNGTLADEFYVDGIPQMNVIVRKNANGSYLFIDPGGKTTTDRFQSRIVGYQERDQLKPLLDAAVAAR
jgi:thioredoxin 1